MRQPNTNLEADVLAAALHAPGMYVRKMLAMLEAEDFESPTTRPVFLAITNVAKISGPDSVTYATVQDELRRMKADSRDVLRLLDPDLGLGLVASFEPKCERLRELRQERMMQRGMLELMQQDFENPQELFDRVTELREETMGLTPRKAKPFEDLIDEMVAEVEYDQQNQDRRIKTGLPTLDRHLHGGFAPGMLVVVGARTGVGKTTFATQVAGMAAMASQRVLFFSMEEAATRMAERVVRFCARIPGSLARRDVEPLMRAAFEERWRSLPLVVLQEHRLDAIVNEMSEQVLEREGVSLVVVDYVGLVQTASHWESKVQEVSEITRSLKHAAMELRVPVMLLAQVNRSPMSRSDKTPQLSDLRDSGSLEQDADVVILLHQDQENPAADSLRLSKHRYGPTGRLVARYDYARGRVEEVTQHG